MAKIASPFNPSGNWPIDKRLVTSATSALSSIDPDFYPAGYITVNTDINDKENNGLWVYVSSNSASEETGRWRKVADAADTKKIWQKLEDHDTKINNCWSKIETIETSAKIWNMIPKPVWETTASDNKYYVIQNNVWTEMPAANVKISGIGDNINVDKDGDTITISSKNTTDLSVTDDGLLNFLNGILEEED